MKRECGNCTACCVYFPVHVMASPAYEPCKRLKACREVKKDKEGMPLMKPFNYQLPTEHNCTDYDGRPEICSGYACAWLKGFGEDGDRPDRCGIIFDQNAPEMIIEDAFIAKPLWLEAPHEARGKQAIENMSRSSDLPVMVLEFTERRLLRVVGRGIA